MSFNQRRYEILRRVEAGELSVDEGNLLLSALDAGAELPSFGGPVVPEQIPPADPVSIAPEVIQSGVDEDANRRMERWQRWWILPFGIGIFITILSAYWMYLGIQAAGFSWGFWLSWFPFLFGLALAVLSWYSQTLPWLHVRVRGADHGRSNVSLSFPIPVGIATWGLRQYRTFAPNRYEEAKLDEVMTVMTAAMDPDAPLHIEVDDKDGSHVEVFITGGRPA